MVIDCDNLGSRIGDLNLSYVWGHAFRRKLISDNGIRFNENMRLGEDSVFMKECLYHVFHSVVTMSYVGYNYASEGSASLSSRYIDNAEYAYTQIYLAHKNLEKFKPYMCPGSSAVMVTMAKINNLFTRDSPYTFLDKVRLVRAMMGDSGIRDAMCALSPKSSAQKIARFCFKNRLPMTLCVAYCMGKR